MPLLKTYMYSKKKKKKKNKKQLKKNKGVRSG